MKSDSLPTNYESPSKIVIGTNTLENVKNILSFNGYFPLLIGNGEKPHIWINIPKNREGTEWYPLVKDNFSTNPKVIVIEGDDSIKITTPDGVIIECQKRRDGSILVNKLDLRPFGLNVLADNEKLTVMNQSFKDSTFKNINTMFGIGNA